MGKGVEQRLNGSHGVFGGFCSCIFGFWVVFGGLISGF